MSNRLEPLLVIRFVDVFLLSLTNVVPLPRGPDSQGLRTFS